MKELKELQRDMDDMHASVNALHDKVDSSRSSRCKTKPCCKQL